MSFDVLTSDSAGGAPISGPFTVTNGSELRFWSAGGLFFSATSGSAKVQIEPDNIRSAFGVPTVAPKDINRPAIYQDSATGFLYFWDPNTGGSDKWGQSTSGATGTAGPPGSPGAQGSDGAQGPPGESSSSSGGGGTGATGSFNSLTVIGDVTIGGKLNVAGLIDPTGLVLNGQASTPLSSPGSGDGVIWVDNSDSPSKLVFTDDAGDDVDLSRSHHSAGTFDFVGGSTGATGVAFTSTANYGISVVSSPESNDSLQVSSDGFYLLSLFAESLPAGTNRSFLVRRNGTLVLGNGTSTSEAHTLSGVFSASNGDIIRISDTGVETYESTSYHLQKIL